jgi:hypothetical protein
MGNIRTLRLARILVPEDEFRLRRIQRAEARLQRAFVGAWDVYLSPYMNDAARDQEYKAFELVHRQQGKGGAPWSAPIVSLNCGSETDNSGSCASSSSPSTKTRRKRDSTAKRQRQELAWTPPLPYAHTLEDPLSDEAGRLIVAMNAIPTWTIKKRTLYENLLRHLRNENYYFFQGNLRTYPIARTGASVLYKVPGDKKGHLARFRNKTIRLLRTGSEGFGTAHFAAKDLLILKI